MTAPPLPPVLTLVQAEDLADRTLARITRELEGYQRHVPDSLMVRQRQADLARVESDYEGLRDHREHTFRPGTCARCQAPFEWPCHDARRDTASLLRTAALYDVTP
jgi:hypothetical protein